MRGHVGTSALGVQDPRVNSCTETCLVPSLGGGAGDDVQPLPPLGCPMIRREELCVLIPIVRKADEFRVGNKGGASRLFYDCTLSRPIW